MTTTYVGGMTIGEEIPGAVEAVVAAVGDVQARLDAIVDFGAAIIVIPPSIEADLEVAASIIANLQLAIEPPSIALQAQILADVMAALAAQLSAFAALMGLFATAGIHVWHYNGRADTLGAEMTTELSGGVPGGGGGAADINALIIATELSATWTAMQGVFKTAP